MRPVKDANFLKQHNSHATTFTLADLCAKVREERLNIAPLNIAARRAREDQVKGALMLSLHARMVPESGTEEE